MKKRTLLVTSGVVLMMLGCTFSVSTPGTPTQVDEVGTVVAATLQTFTQTPGEETPDSEETATPPAEQTSGTPVSLEYASFVVPEDVANGASADKMTAISSNSSAPWEVAPTHLRFTLTGYPLEGKFHEPRIFVYPADEYAGMNSNAAEQIDRIKKLLGGAALMKETLPTVTFFNAQPLIAANIQIVSFQNGSGVRTLTQYAQYAAPINNRELFYHFQGLTGDGEYYVIAILPVTAPFLAEDEKPEAPVPAEGVPLPADTGPNEVYYFSVTEKLNALPPDSYTPSLNSMDVLIQSILIANP